MNARILVAEDEPFIVESLTFLLSREGHEVMSVADGAEVIEKHVALTTQARPVAPWEALPDEFRQLRALVNDDPARRFKGRWQYA